jgi:ferredoxin
MKKIVLLPAQITVEVNGSDTLLRELKSAGVAIKSSCGGHATCADCVVKVVRGEENLTSAPFEELRLLGNVFHLTRERLACQMKACGEVVLDISGHEAHRVAQKNYVTTLAEDDAAQAQLKLNNQKITVRKSTPTSKPSFPTAPAAREKRNRPTKKGGSWRPKSFKTP